MIKLDEDALICDFAETYHIFDYKALSPCLAATLAVGLREDSRVKMQVLKRKAQVNTILLAGIVDRLSVLLAGDKATLLAKNFIDEERPASCGFATAAEFDAAWASLGADNG